MSSTMVPAAEPPVTGAPGVVLEATGSIDTLFQVIWAARGSGEKMDTYAVIEALKSKLDAVLVEVLRDLDVSKGAEALGWASAKDFATSVSGGHKGSGPAAVRLAEAFERPVMAPVAEAMRDGWLSTAKAQVIERSIEQLPSGGTSGLAGCR